MKYYTLSLFNGYIGELELQEDVKSFYNKKFIGKDKFTLYPLPEVWTIISKNKKLLEKVSERLKPYYYSNNNLGLIIDDLKDFEEYIE